MRRAVSIMSKFTERNREIYQLYEDGDSYVSIADRYSISAQRIYQICRYTRAREKFLKGEGI